VESRITQIDGALADGVDPASVEARFVDGYGNPCAGFPVTVSATGADDHLSPEAGVTGADGTFTVELRSTRAELKSVSFSAGGLVLTGSVGLVAGPFDPGASSLTVTHTPARADGQDRAQLSLHVADAFGNPISSYVQVTVVDPATGQQTHEYLFGNGTADRSLSLVSTVAGHRDLTFFLDGLTLFTAGVDFVPGPPSALQFSGFPSAFFSGEPAPLTVRVTDDHGNVIPGAGDDITLSLAAGSSRPALLGTLTRSAVNGTASFDDLRIDRVAATLRLEASAGALHGVSPLFDVHGWHPLGPDGGEVSDVMVADDGMRILLATVGGGVFRSLDKGKTFAPSNQGLGSRVVRKLYSAGAADHFFALTDDAGLFISLDGGGSWSPRNSGLTSLATRSIVWHPPASADVLGTAAGVFMTTDLGASWTPINDGLTDLDVRAVLSSNQLLFAATGSGRVFKSVDQGASWTDTGLLLGGPATSLANGYSAIYVGSLGGGAYQSADQGVTWTPVTGLPSTRINGFAPRGYSEFYAFTADAGLFRTSDRGVTWSPVAPGLPPDVRALGIASGYNVNVRILGTSRGAFLSTDNGQTYLESDRGVSATRVWDLAPDPAPPGAQWVSTDDGVFHGDGTTWVARSGGLPFTPFVGVAVDPGDPAVVYTASAGAGVFKSTDAGQSWAPMNGGLSPLPTLVALRLDPNAPSTLYALGGDARVLQTRAGAASWSGCGPVGAAEGRALALDPASGTLYLGTEVGLFVSTDGCASWTPVGNLGPVHDLWIGQGLYAATPNGVWLSADDGASWSALPGFAADTLTVAEDPASPGRLFAATSQGVLRSDDGGATSTPTAEPVLAAHAFAFDPASPGALFVETLGQGLLRSLTGGR
jgi:photosystem II stability/assembly factor-like uncharacterized protein